VNLIRQGVVDSIHRPLNEVQLVLDGCLDGVNDSKN